MPLIGLDAFSTHLLISSISSALPATEMTEQLMLRSSAKKPLSMSLFPALRERKIKFRAPLSTIQEATDLPRPPRPPVKRYEASGSKKNGFIDEVPGIVERSVGILTTAFPMWSPFWRYRKLCSMSLGSKTAIGRIGLMRPCEYISIHLLMTLKTLISTNFGSRRAS